MAGREESVLPRFVSPHIWLYLWILLGLLAAAGTTIWFTQVPVYVAGPAIVIEQQDIPRSGGDTLVLAAFLPPETHARLQIGQPLFLHAGRGAGSSLTAPIIAVEPAIVSPAEARQRFDLDAGAASTITRPAAVAMAHLAPLETGRPPSSYLGSLFSVEVEIGSRRLLSLLPLIGPALEHRP